MWNVNFCIFLIVCGGVLFFVRSNEIPYCFHYTWVPPMFDSDSDRYNCSLFKGVPCIEPLIRSERPPNTSAIWNSEWKIKYPMLCNVTSGNICIKYTFTYNHQIVNASYFCGKAIEDKVEPITSGCYTQSVDGYVLEMCACQPSKGGEPCNMSMNIRSSTVFVIIMLLFTLTSFT